MMPVDRRARLKEFGDGFVERIKTWKAIGGVEEEFFYRLPGEINEETQRFEAAIIALHTEHPLGTGETSIVCATFRKASHAAAERGLTTVCDSLFSREQYWRIRMHWREGSYGVASGLWLVGVTTGFGMSIGRWLTSLGALILVFAFINQHWLDYGEKNSGFVSAMYWSVVTIATLGYGDITPKEPQAMLFAGIEALLGLVFSVTLGIVINERLRRI